MSSFDSDLKTKLLQQECHFTWSLREEDFNLFDLLNRLEEQIRLESGKARVTRAYSSLGFIHYLHGNLQEALTNLQKSVQLAQEYYKERSELVLIVTYGDLAWLHYHMNEFFSCAEYLRQLDRIHETFSNLPLEVLREKGWAFLKFSHKYYSAAKECFRQALELIPDDSDLNTGYAIALYRTTTETTDSQHSPTIQLQKAIKLNTDDAVLHTEKCIKIVISALLKAPENPHVIRYAAKFFRELESVDMAINLLKKALQRSPYSAFMHHPLAMCYKKKRHIADPDESQQYLKMCIVHLERADSLRPSFIINMADLALHYGQDGRISEAERLFEQAFKEANYRKEHLQFVYCSYGKYQRFTKRSEQLAIQNFMQGLRLQPESAEGKMCEWSLEKVAEYRIKRLKDPNDSTACCIQGFIHEVRGETLKAAEFYERALTNELAVSESILLTEIRIWLMGFKETGKSVGDLLFKEESWICDEGQFDNGRLKTVKGKLLEKSAHLVEIDIFNAKRILKWERRALTPGPHVVLLIFHLDHGEFTDETKEILEDLEFLGKKFWNHVIVVFTKGDCEINEYTGAQRGVLEWIREKCGYNCHISGYAPEINKRIELSERMERMISRNKSMHLLLPEISDGASQSPSEDLRGTDKKEDCLFTPEVIVQDGQTNYRLQCNHTGWFHCEFTQLGFNMKGEGEVLYSTVIQESNCPVPTNCYPAGPLYDIRCVQGELSHLKLPHCETSIEDAHHCLSVIHYSGLIVEVLNPENISRTHVTVSIPGTSRFTLSKIINWFKEKIIGQVILMYIQPTHTLHVFLQPLNVDPRKVAECDNYTLVRTTCDCTLKYNSTYSMSCDLVEEHGLSEKPIIKIQPKSKQFQCTFKNRHQYNPTFEIFLPDDVMNVNLRLIKENPEKVKVVWDCEIRLENIL
ncbi:uncharacterized protein LOC127439705 [Myxocyprinus asiaticus]|uniref:uncharacterized protein LOC127439705 n=1 Tax=Myxocyprinus asiaticus TaxID=70543 RepID=UPI00222349EE|nr:uncharacterized protein LOC127439705 [Myxocyprinus asiaticus]